MSATIFVWFFRSFQITNCLRWSENLNVLGKILKGSKVFLSQWKKVIKTDKDSNESIAAKSHKLKFIDNARFMTTSLSILVDNIAERTHKIKCKVCDCFLEYETVKKNSIIFKCTFCNKNYSNIIAGEWKKRLKNTFRFFSNDIDEFILLLRKCVYPYEYMDDGESLMKLRYLKK